VSLGVLGVIVGVVFRAVPAFDIASRQSQATLEAVLADVPARAASAEYYRFWWFCHTDKVVEWRGSKVPPLVHRRPAGRGCSRVAAANALADARSWAVDTAFGFHALQFAYWLALALPALLPCIAWLWQRVQFSADVARVDRSDRQFNFNCLFKQHVDEWAVPVAALPAAMRALRRLTTEGPDEPEAPPQARASAATAAAAAGGVASRRCRGPYRVHFPVEVRFVAPDDAWLSPSQGPGPAAYVGVIMYKPYGCSVEYAGYFRDFERVMAAHGGRPHWAKEFHFAGDAHFAPVYPRWAQFKALRRALDPDGLFLNRWARRVLGADADVDATPPQGRPAAVTVGLPPLPRSVASFGSGGGDGSPQAACRDSGGSPDAAAAGGGGWGAGSVSSASFAPPVR